MTLNAAHLLGIEAEQLGRQDQMAGRGDRQELGDALDDAEDDRDQEDWHRLAGPGLSGGGQVNSPAGEALPLEAAEPFVADRGERRRVDPERFEPGQLGRRHIVVLEHQPLVAGQRRAGQPAEPRQQRRRTGRASARCRASGR